MTNVTALASRSSSVGYNLVGQRLGRKGRDTRERILGATERLLADPDAAISLSAVAREASLAMTTLYLYFGDLVELLLALLEPVLDSSEQSHVAHLRGRWSDAELDRHCLRFVFAYYEFWKKNTRLLHLRNSLADMGDERMREHRVSAARPLIELILRQMDCAQTASSSRPRAMAAILVTGVERVITINTDIDGPPGGVSEDYVCHCLAAQAHLLELGIRDSRKARAGPRRSVSNDDR